ncbi:hypothetical protein BBOV_II002210 [Babesia bovis T2Bo]|uniref:Uncharacterized protein n=1 Tax=Babesia bovis TaxID=5865 RepID=A7ATB6_BABBO|nr:hypothetical protein BBOV_II002210 [Babesia bovis T2Bo]EDO06177.1 hypothetical protein BBOV_II002210 [Babesia bovis T2Bo]|eukprot:XP_001609745.1 hypothetical protein [Babesia bovis T2Bo]
MGKHEEKNTPDSEATGDKKKRRSADKESEASKKKPKKSVENEKAKDKTSKKNVDKRNSKEVKKEGPKDKGKKKVSKSLSDIKPEAAPSIFAKLGQKHVTPPKGDGTRGFYESLLEAHPNSVLAVVYCVEYGLFGGQKHHELYERYQEMRQQGLLKGAAGGVRPAAIQVLQKMNRKSAKKSRDKGD